MPSDQIVSLPTYSTAEPRYLKEAVAIRAAATQSRYPTLLPLRAARHEESTQQAGCHCRELV
jgi:hypothetical protein